MDHQEVKVYEVTQDQLEQLEIQVSWVHKGPRVSLVCQALLVLWDLKANQDLQEQQANLVTRVKRETLDLLANLVQMDYKGHREVKAQRDL